MLIEFSVKNFRSIKEKQTLSMISTSGGELVVTNSFPTLNGKLNLLRSSAIYGPNASGKTNLVKALQTMRRIVLQSAQRQRGEEVGVTPYLFDVVTQTEPSEFSVTLISGNIRYEYGFVATNQQILEEWLLAYPKGKSQTWIDRKFDVTTQQYKWGNAEKLNGPKQLWQETTRPNALFLSTAIQLNSIQLQPIFDWFSLYLKVIPGRLSPRFTIELCEAAKEKAQIVEFLRTADFNIGGIDVEREVSEEGVQEESTKQRVKMVHTGAQGTQFQLDLEDESSGTQKFFAYTGPWLDVLKHGSVLIVDELNDNLHANLVKFLVQLFHDSRLNRANAQLIFTTHETAILSQEVFRRDQIWFTQKDEYNATTIYPLSDFSPRKKVENLEKNYLQGRYGALPYLRNNANLFGLHE